MVNAINSAYDVRNIGYLAVPLIIELRKANKTYVKITSDRINKTPETNYPGLEYKVGDRLDLRV
jgi:hypothetical protein